MSFGSSSGGWSSGRGPTTIGHDGVSDGDSCRGPTTIGRSRKKEQNKLCEAIRVKTAQAKKHAPETPVRRTRTGGGNEEPTGGGDTSTEPATKRKQKIL